MNAGLVTVRLGEAPNRFDWPRRASVPHMTAGELAIRNAVQEVEKMGCHPDLTAVVAALGAAQERLADYVDAQERLRQGVG